MVRGEHEENLLAARDLGNSSIVIDTYVHIVTNSTKLEDGWVSNQTIIDQITVLNARFSLSQISFVLKGATRTVNPAWAIQPSDANDLAMRRALRKGDYKTLNLYYQTDAASGSTLGVCYYPRAVKPGSDEFFVDGCNMQHFTLPGGRAKNYNLGITTVHEVGHWLGLMHTFQGGCEGDGDFVDDTPAEKEAGFACTVGRDSCPGREGVDPIHNYMAYTSDTCKSNFTLGQAARMHAKWAEFRNKDL
ncbi:hypothetical protein B0T16DRAFT_317900 [Cercophora newfieldiana]|uniref:Peptidase M43 pregnancy-associated plasma-A domain-containing protein n=1 Tax=Cercophora newfieldiana TaxID=92897 RepID=A0AA39YSQ1_9PEZI|nr:hypothetical protein B0T16DRAFT_317900 [Cercophora newfieldiana]